MATITVGIDTSRVYNRSSHVIIGSYEAKNEDRQQISLKSLMSTLVMCFFNIFISLKNYKYLETAIGMSTSDTELVWCGTFSIEQSTEYIHIFFPIMEVWNVNSDYMIEKEYTLNWKLISQIHQLQKLLGKYYYCKCLFPQSIFPSWWLKNHDASFQENSSRWESFWCIQFLWPGFWFIQAGSAKGE